MPDRPDIAGWKDKVLFTPGPLTPGRTVKQAMLRDLGSRDFDFISTVKDIRARLAVMTGAPHDFEAVLSKAAGRFRSKRAYRRTARCWRSNGAYANASCSAARAQDRTHGGRKRGPIPHLGDYRPRVETRRARHFRRGRSLRNDHGHCEPYRTDRRIGACGGHRYFVDAMSSFGAVPTISTRRASTISRRPRTNASRACRVWLSSRAAKRSLQPKDSRAV